MNKSHPSLWGIQLIYSTDAKGQNWGAWVCDKRVRGFESFSEARFWVLLELEEQLSVALERLDAADEDVQGIPSD
jgi:hypothetical protein